MLCHKAGTCIPCLNVSTDQPSKPSNQTCVLPLFLCYPRLVVGQCLLRHSLPNFSCRNHFPSFFPGCEHTRLQVWHEWSSLWLLCQLIYLTMLYIENIQKWCVFGAEGSLFTITGSNRIHCPAALILTSISSARLNSNKVSRFQMISVNPVNY